jgi:hypothetical protein
MSALNKKQMSIRHQECIFEVVKQHAAWVQLVHDMRADCLDVMRDPVFLNGLQHLDVLILYGLLFAHDRAIHLI